MNSKITKTIDLNDLTPEQIEQIQSIIDDFKQQNKQEVTYHQVETKGEFDFPNDLFFESEIIQPFKRTTLYGNRS